MIFKRAIVSELSNAAGAVFTVLFSIIFSVGLVRILGEAAGGRLDSQTVFQIVALSALTELPTVLTLTLFISVLMALSRSFRDSEMVVWFSTGQSLFAWIAPVLRFAAPIVVLVAILALVVSPWAQRQITDSRKRFEQRDDVSKVAPGRFIESSGADRVFFVESVDFDGARVRNVFVSHRSGNRDAVMVAASGQIEVRPDGDRYLVLEHGRRYEGKPGEPEYRTSEFERYSLRLDVKPDVPLAEIAARAKATDALWREATPYARAELVWRAGLPVIALMLALLAIPLAWTNPRIGRSFNLIVAVLAFLVYNNGMKVMQAWVQNGRLSFVVAVWLAHAVAATIIVWLFARRVYALRWMPRLLLPSYWRARGAAAQGGGAGAAAGES
ncbi:MAG TPA: LPS export ABC transporter permease LptF [Burkholderiaceae bacterium]|nr:LPS export ABC transporter permease LptF [Burkholderiaceae bacterium]